MSKNRANYRNPIKVCISRYSCDMTPGSELMSNCLLPRIRDVVVMLNPVIDSPICQPKPTSNRLLCIEIMNECSRGVEQWVNTLLILELVIEVTRPFDNLSRSHTIHYLKIKNGAQIAP